MFSIGSIMVIFGAVTELIQKGRPAVEGLIALLGEHNITIRDESLAKMILEADTAKAEVEAELAGRSKPLPS